MDLLMYRVLYLAQCVTVTRRYYITKLDHLGPIDIAKSHRMQLPAELEPKVKKALVLIRFLSL